MWDKPCYRTIEWRATGDAEDGYVVEDDVDLITRSKSGSYREMSPDLSQSIAGNAIALMNDVDANVEFPGWDIFGNLISNMDPDRQARFEDLAGFARDSDFFVGKRKHWVTERPAGAATYASLVDENALDRPVSELDRIDIGSKQQLIDLIDFERIQRAQYVGPNSANDLFGLHMFFARTNMTLAQEHPLSLERTADDSVNFTETNLICSGGPIPNPYVRNLMYGDAIDLPYRFRLDVQGYGTDLGGLDPRELRMIGRHESSEGAEPNWYLADRSGAPVQVGGHPSRPVRGAEPDRYDRDYFTIVKSDNVHPAVFGTDDYKSLVMCGCHGFGTKGSLKAVLEPSIIDELHDMVGGEDFQVLGVAERRPDGITVDIDPHTIRTL